MIAPPPSPSAGPGDPLLVVEGLHREFDEGTGRRLVLAGASAAIARGELAVVVGKSGSGKSTLLHLIAGLDVPDAGTVRIDGVELTALSETRRTLFRRRRIGFVFQFFNLIPTLTVEENLLLPLELNGRLHDEGRRAARRLLAEVGLAGREGSFPDRLSGGEQQRVAVARALVHDPILVLADEPTGNLDLETGREVVELLDRLTRRAGNTLVMVTHSREVVGLADRLYSLEEGRLVEGTAGGGARRSTGPPAPAPPPPLAEPASR